jgi:hypothetical protein
VFFTGPLIAADSPQVAAGLAMERKRQGAGALFVDTGRMSASIIEVLRPFGMPIISRDPNAADTLIGGGTLPVRGFWIPSLAAAEATADPKMELLERSLVQQVAPKGMLERTRVLLAQAKAGPAAARAELTDATRVVAGSGGGQMFVIHGPGIHREMALLVQAGLSPNDALQAATGRAAAALGAGNRIGQLKPGMEADLVLVDGNPLRDITVTERISAIIFRGERVARAELFEQEGK